MKFLKWLRKPMKWAIYLAVAGCCLVVGINLYMQGTVKKRIVTPEQAAELDKVDCILVLGCGVRDDGSPSGMLNDRLLQGIALYNAGVSDRLLMSGDHGRVDYDEVNLMKQFAIDHGVPSEDIFMDHAGFSTYESMYRARDIFQAERIVVVTQEYHMYRALYNAGQMGMDAYGVASDPRKYGGQKIRDAREMLARTKDFLYAIAKPKPTYLGEVGSRLCDKFIEFDARNYGYTKLVTLLKDKCPKLIIIQEGTSYRIELKEQTEPEDLEKEITAFLKRNGGKVDNLSLVLEQLKKKHPNFNLSDYGYSRISSFLRSFDKIAVHGNALMLKDEGRRK